MARKSLLPAGVTGITGTFGRGDPIEIADASGHVLTLGLAGYDAQDARAIMGLKSAQIVDRLGYPGRSALVHRDEMAI